MTYKYSLSLGNKKTGAMLLVRSPRATCPEACTLKGNGCYAYNFPLSLHWEKQDTTGIEWKTVLYAIKTLPLGSLWRLFEAGDFEPSPDNALKISPQQVVDIIEANHGRRGFGYTHYPVEPNFAALKVMNNSGFTINVSANTMDEAVAAFHAGLPTTVVVPRKFPKDKIVAGVRIVVCPAQTLEGKSINCLRCQLCQKPDRDYIIGFRSHGTKAKIVPTIMVD